MRFFFKLRKEFRYRMHNDAAGGVSAPDSHEQCTHGQFFRETGFHRPADEKPTGGRQEKTRPADFGLDYSSLNDRYEGAYRKDNFGLKADYLLLSPIGLASPSSGSGRSISTLCLRRRAAFITRCRIRGRNAVYLT